MDLFEKYAFIRSYSKYLETELKRTRLEIGKLKSEVDRVRDMTDEDIKKVQREAMYIKIRSEMEDLKRDNTDLQFKLLKEITKKHH